MTNIGKCNLCLKQKQLIKAHIIPQSFFDEDCSSRLVSNNRDYPTKRPVGVYDPNILCRECDHFIGTEFDDYAKRTLLDLKHLIIENLFGGAFNQEKITLYRLIDKDGYDKINRFFISLLWRASISYHKDVEFIKMGPYESVAREIILNPQYDYKKYFSIVIMKLPKLQGKVNMFSRRTKFGEINGYIFFMGSMKIYIRCSQQKLPVLQSLIMVSKENDILMLEDDLIKHHEAKLLFDAAVKLMKYDQSKNRFSNKMV